MRRRKGKVGHRVGQEESSHKDPSLLREADPTQLRGLQSLPQVQELPHRPPSHSRAAFPWFPGRNLGHSTLGGWGRASLTFGAELLRGVSEPLAGRDEGRGEKPLSSF